MSSFLVSRIAFVVILLLITIPSAASTRLEPNPEFAYLVFDVKIKGIKRQPTYIAFNDESEENHLPIGTHIVAVKPGRFEFKHVDFGSDYRFSMHTLEFEYGNEFELTAGEILFLGTLEMRNYHHYEGASRVKRRPTFKRKEEPSLLYRACNSAPAVFAAFNTHSLSGEVISNPCIKSDGA